MTLSFPYILSIIKIYKDLHKFIYIYNQGGKNMPESKEIIEEKKVKIEELDEGDEEDQNDDVEVDNDGEDDDQDGQDTDNDDDESVDADVLTDVGLYNVLANFLSYTDEKNEQVSIAESFGSIALELKRLNGYVKRLVPEKASK